MRRACKHFLLTLSNIRHKSVDVDENVSCAKMRKKPHVTLCGSARLMWNVGSLSSLKASPRQWNFIDIAMRMRE